MERLSRLTLAQMEIQAYQSSPNSSVNGWTLLSPHSTGIKAYLKGNTIVVAIRGTADARDVRAWTPVVLSRLQYTARYAEDVRVLGVIQEKYPKDQYSYYCVAHSLGGAIANLLIDQGYIISGIAYNPAVDLVRFRNDTRLTRIYNRDDLLYQTMGRFTKNPEVRNISRSVLGKLYGYTPLGTLTQGIQAHALENFKGGFYFCLT